MLTPSRSRWSYRPIQTFNSVSLLVAHFDTILLYKVQLFLAISFQNWVSVLSRCMEMGDATLQSSRLVCHRPGDSVLWFWPDCNVMCRNGLCARTAEHFAQHEKEGRIKQLLLGLVSYAWKLRKVRVNLAFPIFTVIKALSTCANSCVWTLSAGG